MTNNDGRVYAPNYAIAVSDEEDVVSASAIFDLNSKDGSLVLRELTPPSPFTRKASARWSHKVAPKRKHDHLTPVIDLTGEESQMDGAVSTKHEEVPATLTKIPPRKKAKRL
ncbi:hypothetical protein DFH09DRAFT_1082575 [Mycena vulgaris]|nr:hypothetical protein DFH09DRAFT_1082575 [Mycena vulgaris]